MRYGAENCIVNKKYEGKITVTGTDCWRQSCRFSRMDRIANDEIRTRMKADPDVYLL